MLQSILFLLIIGTVLFLRTKLRETALARLTPMQQTLIALGVLILLLLAFTGKLGLLIPLLGAVVAAFVALVSRLMPIISPLLARQLPQWLEQLWNHTRATSGSARESRRTSTARSPYLEMTLDHQSGHMDGRVRQGPHENQMLSELGLTHLVELYTFYDRVDHESASLLAAYIERAFGGQWQAKEPSGNGSASIVDRSEALQILGLDESATHDDIIAAHRRLMQKVHPDRGGSDYLASRINQAKDHLLGKHPN